MAYNLQSLINILEQIINPKQTDSAAVSDEQAQYFTFVNDYKPQLQSLLQKAASLQQILQKSSIPKLESLESQIKDAAEKAEDIIECHMVNQVFLWQGKRWSTLPAPEPSLHLQQVMEGFDSATEQVKEIILEGKTKKISTGSSSSGAAVLLPDPPSSKNDVLVGHHDDLLQLKDRLTGNQSKLVIVPIFGMGGIGKTTLARKLYEDPLILSHFTVRAWATISQDYNLRDILLSLLCRLNEKNSDSNELTECTDVELKEILYKRLFGRRYLIVLDDMWSTDSWDVIRHCFPDNNKGSRIVLTTRESDVAKVVGTQGCQHKVQLLEKSESWKLICQIVFGGDDSPDIAAFEKIGRRVAGDCGGLPLAINVIGGILSKAERSIAVWESIGEDVSAAIAEADDDAGFSNVLSLSYNHLPHHLKPVLLYMGEFREDYEIKGSRLMRMLVAEGFAKEEEAEDYIEALVERNLLMVTRKKNNGKPLEYGMHDLLRDLCLLKAREERFVHVKNDRVEGTLHNMRRVSVHSRTSYAMEELDVHAMSLVRSFLCFTGFNESPETLTPVFSLLRLVRVLDVYKTEFHEFPQEILLFVNLRYLAISCRSGGLPWGISSLLNLETLIARIHGKYVPDEIWEMPRLTYLKLDTRINIKLWSKFERLNLQVISSVRYDDNLISRCFFESIPEITKMAISCDDFFMLEPLDLTHLHKLQTLKCYSNLRKNGRFFLQTAKFPSSLRKLTLTKCFIYKVVVTTLCALPHLEVLKISNCVFEDEEFEAAEGEVFSSLQLLRLSQLNNLLRWRADETNFPMLQHLVIYDCPLLEEIPSAIGEIPTLQKIKVDRCSPGAEASAGEIRRVQQDDYDNFDLQLTVYD